MTEQPSTHADSAPSGERCVVFTFDDMGRIVSQREGYPVGDLVEGQMHCKYDEYGRMVYQAQSFKDPLSNPGTP